MSLAMSTALSAMTVAQRLAEISSHNIANANTPGYSRQVAVLRAALPIRTTAGLMGTGVTIDRIMAIRDGFLSMRLNAQEASLGKSEIQSKSLAEMEAIILPGPDTGLGFTIDEFFRSVNELATNALSAVSRESVLQSAVTLAGTFKSTTDQLRQLATEQVLDRQSVSSKAGILLENVLDGLALLYALPLPRNKLHLYTLGDMLKACRKLFDRHSLTVTNNVNWDADHQPEDWQAVDAATAFGKVDALTFIRNQVGCHFNLPGTEIPDNVVREFGQATVDLVQALTCPNCGYLAKKIANGGAHLRCTCPKQAIRMTPVCVP